MARLGLPLSLREPSASLGYLRYEGYIRPAAELYLAYEGYLSKVSRPGNGLTSLQPSRFRARIPDIGTPRKRDRCPQKPRYTPHNEDSPTSTGIRLAKRSLEHLTHRAT